MADNHLDLSRCAVCGRPRGRDVRDDWEHTQRCFAESHDLELWESELHPRGSNEFLLVGLAVLAATFMVGFVVFVL